MTTAGIAIVVACLTLPALGADDRHTLRGGLMYVSPTGDQDLGGGVSAEADSAVGLRLAYEFRFRENIGIQFGLGSADHDAELKSAGASLKLAEVSFRPLGAAVLFHLTPDSKVDFYVGPGIAYVLWGDLEIEPSLGGGEIALDGDFALTAEAGIDVPVGDGGWSINANLRYIGTTAESELASDEINLDVNPIVLGVGFGKRF